MPEIEVEKAELFRVLSAEALAGLRPGLREHRFERGQLLYLEGAPADRLWVVRRGEVRLYKGSPDGRTVTLDLLRPGEAFGAALALEVEAHPSSAEAVTSGSAWTLSRDRFLALLEREPRVAADILHVVSRRLRDAHDRLRAFAQDAAPARLAAALLRALPAEGDEARVTRRALAESAGTTVETAIRVLRRLEREGLLQGEVGRIRLLDEAALRALAGQGGV